MVNLRIVDCFIEDRDEGAPSLKKNDSDGWDVDLERMLIIPIEILSDDEREDLLARARDFKVKL